MSGATESPITAEEAQAFCSKLAAWVGTLSERERRLLAAAVRRAGEAEIGAGAEDQVQGYYTAVELLTVQSIVGLLVGTDMLTVNATRDAAQKQAQDSARRYLSQLR